MFTVLTWSFFKQRCKHYWTASNNDETELFFVGNKISIADLAIWRLLGWLSSGLLDGVPTNILEPYKKLNKLREEVYKHPKVNEWMLKTYGKII